MVAPPLNPWQFRAWELHNPVKNQIRSVAVFRTAGHSGERGGELVGDRLTEIDGFHQAFHGNDLGNIIGGESEEIELGLALVEQLGDGLDLDGDDELMLDQFPVTFVRGAMQFTPLFLEHLFERCRVGDFIGPFQEDVARRNDRHVCFLHQKHESIGFRSEGCLRAAVSFHCFKRQPALNPD